ncbi:MAG: Stp1/IreP family PP2C-type Ser/Thr phosphatase [Terriglobia bacterium]
MDDLKTPEKRRRARRAEQTLSVEFAALTDVGRQRATNEDSVVTESWYAAVADGMGGHAGGDVASRIAIDVASERLGQDRPPGTSRATKNAVKLVFDQANREILEQSLREPELRGMGTTLTVLAVWRLNSSEAKAYLGHVGDSRAYLIRAGAIEQLTQDHSIVAQMVREGELTQEEADKHPMKSILTRSLGTHDSVETDLSPVELRRNDIMLLCSDGLTGLLSDGEINAVMTRPRSLDEYCKELVDTANSRGGTDNVSVVLARLS